MTKLSIIIPCYNCTATLEEAVASIYTQELQIPYEVVMVDDGSTDGTRDMIVKLSKEYPHIRYVFHKKNRGGGAARNTAVEHSTGDMIFCLDSDDILPSSMLPRLVNYLDEKKCDGVTFSEIRFFKGVDKRTVSSNAYPVTDEPIRFEALFTERRLTVPVIVNFLYTKTSFYVAGGYPTEHCFDTQGYGYRYLSKNLQVYVCPNSFYLHRQVHPKNKSYFERAYECGDYSKNLYFILEDIMYLLEHSSREEVLRYDIWSNNELRGHNIMAYLKDLWFTEEKELFIKDYQKYMRENGWDMFFDEHRDSTAPMDIYCCGIYCYKKHNYSEALEYYKSLLLKGYSTNIVYMNIFRILMAMSGQYEIFRVEASFQELVNSMTLRKRELFSRGNRLQRLLKRIKEIRRYISIKMHGLLRR